MSSNNSQVFVERLHWLPLTAVSGKLSAPQKTEPDTSIWYGVSTDGSMCHQLKLTKAKGNETGTVDKANCGIK